MVALLDTSAWAKDTTTYTEKALKELDEHYNPLLLKNNFNGKYFSNVKCEKKLNYSNY